jgi:hypothetical protein
VLSKHGLGGLQKTAFGGAKIEKVLVDSVEKGCRPRTSPNRDMVETVMLAPKRKYLGTAEMSIS